MPGMQQAASNLDPQTLAQIQAYRNQYRGVTNNDSTVWFQPGVKSEDGYALNDFLGRRHIGGESGTDDLDPMLDQSLITRLVPDTGGNVLDRWDSKTGAYLGRGEAQNGGGGDMNRAIALIAGGYFGGAQLAGANGAGAAIGETAAQDLLAAGGGFATDTGTLVGGSTLTSGGTTAFGTTLADAGIGTGLAGAGTAAAGTGAINAANVAANPATTSLNVKDWAALANAGVGAVAAVTAGNAADKATDAATHVADSQVDLSRSALDWYKQTYADEKPARDAAQLRANNVSDAQLRLMTSAADQADELYNYNKTTFRPIEQRLVADAAGYDTPERRMAAAASAGADVDVGVAGARQAQMRALARTGIAPGSTKSMALQEDSNVAQGVARGAAQTGAVRNVEQQGHARMADVANLGRGIASQQATEQGIATTNGNSSVANSNAGLAAAQSGNSFMGSGINTAMNGLNSAGNLFNSIAKTNQTNDQQLLSGIGNIGTFLGSYGSDKTIKKGTGRMASAAASLKAIEKTPVHKGWQYDPTKGGPDDGGKKHDGPMAQDVHRTMGEAAAPGGKAIDIATMNGRMLGAIQELSKRVKSLEKVAA